MTNDYKLTRKQQTFVDAYVTNGHNATQAAKLAGYSDKTACVMGYENLQKPYIAAKVELRMKEAAEKLGISPEYRLQGLKELFEGGKQLYINREGRHEFTDSSAAVRAAQLMNSMIGDCESKDDNSNTQEVIREEIRKQIEQSKKEY